MYKGFLKEVISKQGAQEWTREEDVKREGKGSKEQPQLLGFK